MSVPDTVSRAEIVRFLKQLGEHRAAAEIERGGDRDHAFRALLTADERARDAQREADRARADADALEWDAWHRRR